MNTVTLATPNLSAQALGVRVRAFSWRDILRKDNALVCSLSVAVFVAALSVVYVKNTQRTLFSQVQTAQLQADKLEVEWGKLLLEQSTLARVNRVHHVAAEQYAMHVPQSNEVTVVEY